MVYVYGEKNNLEYRPFDNEIQSQQSARLLKHCCWIVIKLFDYQPSIFHETSLEAFLHVTAQMINTLKLFNWNKTTAIVK